MKKLFIYVFVCFIFISGTTLIPISASENSDEENVVTNDSSSYYEAPMVFSIEPKYSASGNAGSIRMDYAKGSGFQWWINFTAPYSYMDGAIVIQDASTKKIIKSYYITGTNGTINLSGLKRGKGYNAIMNVTAFNATGHAVGWSVPNSYYFTY